MQSKATTVADYLKEQSPEGRRILQAVRKVILANLDRDFEEGMQYGMIGYYVPHRVFPPGYHCDPRQPLPFVALAAQKNYYSLYMMGLYVGTEEEAAFRKAWAATGKKLDMGKCCVRFKSLDDLPLELIGHQIARETAQGHIRRYQESRATARPRPAQPASKTPKPGGKSRLRKP